MASKLNSFKISFRIIHVQYHFCLQRMAQTIVEAFRMQSDEQDYCSFLEEVIV
jgi:hypothetical protein